jgi:hypothetical protein
LVKLNTPLFPRPIGESFGWHFGVRSAKPAIVRVVTALVITGAAAVRRQSHCEQPRAR